MSVPTSEPGAPPSGAALTCHAAQFATHWLTPSLVVISVHGELDAANSAQLVDYALRHAANLRHLVLDLTGVEFFGIAGFSAAHTLNTHCAQAHIAWALVPSAAVARLLHICDSDTSLPVCDDLPTALIQLHGDQSNLLKLIPKPR